MVERGNDSEETGTTHVHFFPSPFLLNDSLQQTQKTELGISLPPGSGTFRTKAPYFVGRSNVATVFAHSLFFLTTIAVLQGYFLHQSLRTALSDRCGPSNIYLAKLEDLPAKNSKNSIMNHGREPPRYPTLLESPDDSFGGSKNHGKHGKAGVQPQPSVPQQEQRHDFVADDEAFVVDQLLKGKKLKALQRAADWFGTGSEDAAPVGSKSLNRNTARGSYLSRGYRAWIEWQTSRATQIRIFETLRELLMFALAAKICLFSADYTLWQLCSRYLLALAFQPFFFAIVHVYLHSQMLNCFQRHGTVGVPLAFFHHYTDPRVYGLIPYAYRYETLRAADFVMIIPFSFLVGVDQFLYLSHLHAQFLDILVHEW